MTSTCIDKVLIHLLELHTNYVGNCFLNLWVNLLVPLSSWMTDTCKYACMAKFLWNPTLTTTPREGEEMQNTVFSQLNTRALRVAERMVPTFASAYTFCASRISEKVRFLNVGACSNRDIFARFITMSYVGKADLGKGYWNPKKTKK